MRVSDGVDNKQSIGQRWQALRLPSFAPLAEELVRQYAPSLVGEVVTVTALRSAHYAVLRVDSLKGSWVVRIGVCDDDDRPVDNSAYLGTSHVSPTGQQREYVISQRLSEVGAAVCLPVWYERIAEGYDLQWLPFLAASTQPISAGQWYQVLSSFWQYHPSEELPVFTNRAKTMARLSQLPSTVAADLQQQYDSQLATLFAVTSTWSVVHGDAHGDNAINTGERVLLFDLDTACWAPSVWDLTHLLNRAGTGSNGGYTAHELSALFPFTEREVAAAVALRQTAADIAAEYRNVA